MIELKLPDLSCGHCVAAVTKTLKELDPQAQVDIDLPTKHLQLDSQASRDAVVAALTESGYPPG